MPRRNLNTTLRRRAQTDPMRAFDALPPVLRHWLAQARLPWNPGSARRIWARALARHAGDPAAALQSLDRAERRSLARDAPRVWGPDHPAAAP